MNLVAIEDVSKYFGDFCALKDVSLHVEKGTIHAILGENGAGKTTLMNIIYGLYQPEEGQVRFDGREVFIDSPRAAIELGIGMIHQHFMLVDTLSVTENVILGLEGDGLKLNLEQHQEKLAALSKSLGFDVNPTELIWKLPMGMQQRVEIMKALYRNAKLLILDEPTSILTPEEVDGFLEFLRNLRSSGCTVIIITHKLREIMEVADRVTVLRHGRVTAETELKDTTAQELAQLMVGRDVFLSTTPNTDRPCVGKTIGLQAKNLSATNTLGVQALKNVSIEVRQGEILGVAGVDGNGQAELAEVLTGLRKLDAGQVSINGEDITTASVDERRHKYGISYVPEDRHHVGLVLDYSVTDNFMLRDFEKKPFSKHKIVDRNFLNSHSESYIHDFDIRLHSPTQKVRFLSGGNQQKIIVAREVHNKPDVLIVMQPCKGLDIGAIDFVQKTIEKERNRGVAVLYISTELEHILGICDRIAVMCQGSVTGVLSNSEATPEKLGILMAGAGSDLTC
ncbi:MAG: ABC transporter ATP-binding protein [Motiliproteus sp.]